VRHVGRQPRGSRWALLAEEVEHLVLQATRVASDGSLMMVCYSLCSASVNSPFLRSGPQVRGPPEATALAAPLQPGVLGDEAPVARAALRDVGEQLVVLLGRPAPALHVVFLAAPLPPPLM
jgi:hypothetical protein